MEASLPRRDFIKTVSGAAVAPSALSYSRILGAANRVRLGVVGCGGRGTGDMKNFLALGNVDVPAVCDVFATNVDTARKAAPGAVGVKDHRQLLDRNDIDAVLIAVPDHWHMPITIDALNAGKDVYVEKPLTLTIEEGPAIVKAARLNKRVCQVGMQQRSGRHYLQAKQEYFDSGRIGKLTLVRTWWHGNSWHLRRAPASLQTQPSNLDWARFVGPLSVARLRPAAILELARLPRLRWRTDHRPLHPLDRRRPHVHGAGDAGVCVRGRRHLPLQAGRTAPDTINVLLDTRRRSRPRSRRRSRRASRERRSSSVERRGGCGSRGAATVVPLPAPSNGGSSGGSAGPQPVVVQASGDLDRDHMQNFLDCVVSRKTPNGDVLIGHRSAQASHLGNISYVQKRRIHFDPLREQILPA